MQRSRKYPSCNRKGFATEQAHFDRVMSQVRTASCGAVGCVNSFGDEQLAIDMLADKILFEHLKFSVSAESRGLI